MVEAKLPCDLDIAPALAALAGSLAERCALPIAVAQAMQHAIGEAAALIRRQASDANETCTVLLVADHDKMQAGFVAYGNALNLKPDDAALKALQGRVDEVKHLVLPTRGCLLTLTKRK